MTSEQLKMVCEWGENLAHCRQPEISEAIAAVLARLEACEAAMVEAGLQITYLHEKFRETGSGNAVLARLRALLQPEARP